VVGALGNPGGGIMWPTEQAVGQAMSPPRPTDLSQEGCLLDTSAPREASGSIHMIRLGPRCANPHCPLQRSVWRTFLKPPRGVVLHKQWLCSPDCLNQVLEQSLVQVIETTRANRDARSHRFPLGLVMHSLGLVTKESLQSALQAQREAGQGRVGD